MPINKTKNTNLKKKVSNIGMKDSLLQNSYLTDDELRVYKKPKLSCSNIQYKTCFHEWVIDLIDIDPDRSQRITYCKHCEFTKS
jgi:hypothetical protein